MANLPPRSHSGKRIAVLLAVAFVLTFGLLPGVLTESAAAQPAAWPTTWLPLDTDPISKECPGEPYRDVGPTWYAVDDTYIYLRMCTENSTGWPDPNGPDPYDEARYKWFFDTTGGDAYISGTSANNAEFLLMVEDYPASSAASSAEDGLGEIYLLDDLANVGFTTRWDSTTPPIYYNNTIGSTYWRKAVASGTAGVGGPQEVMTADVGFRIGTNSSAPCEYFIDMYVSRSALGNPSSLCVLWATEKENNNLDQAPNCDRPAQTSCYGILCNINVVSDGCCNTTVTWDSESANVSAGGNQTFTDIPCGTNVTLTANTSACCAFVNWTGDVPGGTNSTNPITITMEGAKNITATCRWLSYNLTVESDGCCPIQVAYNLSAGAVNTTVSANASANFTIPCCTNVTLVADDSDLCCDFVRWVVDGENVTNGNNITVHMGANHTAVATCRGLSFNLTTNANPPEGGTVSGGGTYNCCTNVTVNATPADSCWYFTGWSGDLAGTDNPTSFHIDGNKNVTANFARYSYNLTVESDGCCPIDVSWDSSSANVSANASANFTIPCCTNVTLYADDSDPSCGFVEWVADGASRGAGVNNITVHMGSNHTAVAICNVTVTCSIGDTLFYDNNGNGVRDPYESGIPGVQVNLYQDDGNGVFNPSGGSDDLVASVITDAAGRYKFTGLNCCATYWVYVVPGTLPPSLTLTTGTNPWGPITLDPEGEDYDMADFGYRPPIPVGGEAYPINKISVLAPWVGLVMFLAGPGAFIVLRRKKAARQN